MPEGLVAHNHVKEWHEENKGTFKPPVCNKLMHKDQLTVMFVGGPNTRTDFHLDEGSEFFYQMQGNIELPTIQCGKRKLVKIGQGQVFLLPSRVPHSPQRPEEGSFGLVVERRRGEGEKDGLRWYTDFDKCDQILYENFFHCGDLGRDLVPVVKAYKESEECRTSVPGDNVLAETDRPVRQDTTTEVPPPFLLSDFLVANEAKLASGEALKLFGEDHPDKEFCIMIVGGASEQRACTWRHETWLYQLRGSARVTTEDGALDLDEGCCVVVKPDVRYDVMREDGSIGMVVTQDPEGNK